MEFSAASCAMEGFRLIGRKPGTFLLWCLMYFAVLILFGIVWFAIVGTAAIQAAASGSHSPAAMGAAYEHLWPMMLVAYPLMLVWAVMFCNAVIRSVLRPEEQGFAYLKFGADEWRVLLLQLIYFVAFCVVGAVFSLVMVTLLPRLGQMAGVGSFVLGLAAFCFYIWAVVRLSLMIAYTVGERKLDLAGGWRLTAGRFWGLLGMFLLDFVIMLAVLFAAYLIVASFFLSAILGAMGHGGAPTVSPGSVGLSLIGILVGMAVYFVLPTFMIVMLVAPQAAAYKALRPKGNEAIAA